jgi:Rad52/22 family double-strand break repair protein
MLDRRSQSRAIAQISKKLTGFLPHLQFMEEINRPTKPGEWSLLQIQEALSRKLPEKMVAKRKQGGKLIPYIPWQTAARILDKYAPGWHWQIQSISFSADRIFLIGRLTIPTANGETYREATGTELLKRMDEEELKELAYGDPSSNAESMAFRRAAAKFGLGLYLYDE